MPTIIFNGQSYSDPDAMPPDVRQAYEKAQNLLADKNRNNVPDIMENLIAAANPQREPMTFAAQQIVVEGKVYNSLDELPPELRDKYTQAMAKMSAIFGDANQNGVPDIMEDQLRARAAAQRTSADPAAFEPPPTTVIGDPGPNWLGLLALVGGLGILAIFCVLSLWFLLPMFK